MKTTASLFIMALFLGDSQSVMLNKRHHHQKMSANQFIQLHEDPAATTEAATGNSSAPVGNVTNSYFYANGIDGRPYTVKGEK